jgi:hypothetical protein
MGINVVRYLKDVEQIAFRCPATMHWPSNLCKLQFGRKEVEIHLKHLAILCATNLYHEQEVRVVGGGDEGEGDGRPAGEVLEKQLMIRIQMC